MYDEAPVRLDEKVQILWVTDGFYIPGSLLEEGKRVAVIQKYRYNRLKLDSLFGDNGTIIVAMDISASFASVAKNNTTYIAAGQQNEAGQSSYIVINLTPKEEG